MMTSTGILRGDNSIADQQEGPLTVAAAEEWIQRTCFSTGPAGRIGLELELLMGRIGDPSLQRPFADDNYRRLFSEMRHLDVHGSLTLEPGGQLELSSHPEASLRDLIFSVHGSLKLLREQAAIWMQSWWVPECRHTSNPDGLRKPHATLPWNSILNRGRRRAHHDVFHCVSAGQRRGGH